MFNVVQQLLRYYIVAMADISLYITSVTYAEPEPNTSTDINFPHLYEELIFV